MPSPPRRPSSHESRTAIEVWPDGLIWDRLVNTFGRARNLRDVLREAPELLGGSTSVPQAVLPGSSGDPTRPSRGRVGPPLGWDSVAGTGSRQVQKQRT